MIQAAELDLPVPRHAPFDYSLVITGLDLTGATAEMQVRLYPDAAGSTLLDLLSTGGSSRLEISTNTSGHTPVATIRIVMAKADLATLPAAAEVGDDLTLAYDLHVTPIGIGETVLFKGDFNLLAGVTR